MNNSKVIKISSREQLLNTLTEASELEHNLMCLYLFAVFSLKQDGDHSLNPEEQEMVRRWEKTIMNIAIQEMGHLALVSNITTSIGGTASFHRPNFPVSPGYYPSDFVIELAPLNVATLEHFIFLERPSGSKIETSADFEANEDYEREAPQGRLMSHTGDYETVADLYKSIEDGLEFLSKQIGGNHLFCGNTSIQIGPDDLKLTGLIKIRDLETAKKAIKTIVEQGEGGNCDECHFNSFEKIKKEYDDYLVRFPKFEPSRNCARNPVMRKPTDDDSSKVWINHPEAVKFLDVGNALYSLMLRTLVQIYSMETRDSRDKKFLLSIAFKIMSSLAIVSKIIPFFPADEESTVRAGMSFSLDRNITAFELNCEKQLIRERVTEILSKLTLYDANHLYGQDLQKVSTLLKTILENPEINS
jgi:hypothetical protein